MKVEIREESIVIDGYVNAVERYSKLLPKRAARDSKRCKGPFGEKVAAGTFYKAVKRNPDILLEFNHLENRKLGSTREGNLKLYEDNIGLRAYAVITDPEVIERARNKELRGWSFGFKANLDEWKDSEEFGCQERTLHDIDLTEVSILTKIPAYNATSIELRDKDEIELRFIDDEVETNLMHHREVPENNKTGHTDLSFYHKSLEFLKFGGKI